MNIESVSKEGYHVLRVKEDLRFNSDLSEVWNMIQEGLESGVKNFALSLTPKSHLSSMSIGTMLQCNKKIKDHGGKLALIQANKEETALLEMLRINRLITHYNSEEELGGDRE